MLTLNVRNVNDALVESIKLIDFHGITIPSPNGDVLEIPEPVSLTYRNSWEKVLVNETRNTNHFSNLMASLWVLAGRNDVKFVSEFDEQIVNYSNDQTTVNDAPGYRIKHFFGINQLKGVIELLKKDPNSHHAVIQIWCAYDLNRKVNDKVCDTEVIFKIRNANLYMTVYSRSSNLIFGLTGAKNVQLSILQEYIAANLNVFVGPYTHVTNAFYVNTETDKELWNKLNTNNFVYKQKRCSYDNEFDNLILMRHYEIDAIKHDLKLMFKLYDDEGLTEIIFNNSWKSEYFRLLILPVINTWVIYTRYGVKDALKEIHSVKADDWRKGCEQWLKMSMKNEKQIKY